MIPDWAWALLAVAVVGVALALFMTDSSDDPGFSLVYDIAEYEAVEASDLRYRETARIPLDIATPTALAVTEDGRILAAGDGMLLVLDADGEEMTRHETGVEALCMAVAPDGVVYVGTRDRVVVFAATGEPLSTWKSLGERARLTSLVADERHLFVADSGNARVYRYTHDGTLLNVIGEREPEKEYYGFVIPSHYFEVALDTTGALWVTNPGKLGVEKYREDGALLSAWHQPGFDVDKFPGCCNPIHIAFTSDGALVTAEKGINRIKVFAADRSFIGVAAAPELLNAGWRATDFPTETAAVRDLAVDKHDRILALHGPLDTLLIFEPLQEYEETL